MQCASFVRMDYTPVWVLQTRPEKKHLAQFGLDLIKGEVRNNVQAGVLEPVLAKTKIIQVLILS